MTPQLRTGLPALVVELRLATPVTPVPWPSVPERDQRVAPPTFARMLASVDRRPPKVALRGTRAYTRPKPQGKTKAPGCGGLAFEAMSLACRQAPSDGKERCDA